MMNRQIILAIVAAIFLSLPITCTCAGSGQTPPTLSWIAETEQATQWAEILGFVQPLESLRVTQGYDVFTDKIYDYQPDFISVESSGDETPKTLYQSGVIEAFSPTEAMLEEISEMPPWLQHLFHSELMTEDGRILGYPSAGDQVVWSMFFVGYWIPDAWKASPFRDRTPPSSFEELLDFIEVFLDTPHDGFRLYYSPRGKEAYLNEVFVDSLIGGWVVQHNYAEQPIVFSDPEFIALAERSQQLYQRLMKTDYGKKANWKTRYLFAECQATGMSYNCKDTFTCANMIPLRITSDQPPLINAKMILYCVNKSSAYVSSAAELFETTIPHTEMYYGLRLYDVWAFPDKFDVKATNSFRQKDKSPGYSRYTQEWVDSIKGLDQYVVPCLEKSNWMIKSQYGECMRAKNQFFIKGKMTAEEFAAELDREWAAAIHGANDKTIWIEEFGDE